MSVPFMEVANCIRIDVSGSSKSAEMHWVWTLIIERIELQQIGYH